MAMLEEHRSALATVAPVTILSLDCHCIAPSILFRCGRGHRVGIGIFFVSRHVIVLR